MATRFLSFRCIRLQNFSKSASRHMSIANGATWLDFENLTLHIAYMFPISFYWCISCDTLHMRFVLHITPHIHFIFTYHYTGGLPRPCRICCVLMFTALLMFTSLQRFRNRYTRRFLIPRLTQSHIKRAISFKRGPGGGNSQNVNILQLFVFLLNYYTIW